MRIGLTGGIGTGKSTVGKILADLGCHLIEADALGHEVLAPDGAAYIPFVEHFGTEFLRHDGTINRKALGAHVFGSQIRLNKLNSIVHPAVHSLYQKKVMEIEAPWFAEQWTTRRPIIVYEAAILFECNLQSEFDGIVIAWCPPGLQIDRVMRRDSLDRTEVLQRIDNQMSVNTKVLKGNWTVDTSGDIDSIMIQAGILVKIWSYIT